jgi:adenine-specific DNA-methyltransferase
MEAVFENKAYLTRQIITYIGNKRSLLDFIGKGIAAVQKKLKKQKLILFDVFSGSGIVARYFKRYAHLLIVNDLEKYAGVINRCYLSNRSEINMLYLKQIYAELMGELNSRPLQEGIISDLYAPENDGHIKPHERVFYTHRNAMYIDTARGLIEKLPEPDKVYYLAPLLSEASIHSNTSGVFKGFYKNKETGIGQFGGKNQDALLRIKGNIGLPFPVFSNFNCDILILNDDAHAVIQDVPEADLAYLDPPYNQHPYGSNYFMLNLILDYKYPETISDVSGIPKNWNRSGYNKKRHAFSALSNLVAAIKAKYVLISFNSEGFVSIDEMKEMLQSIGRFEVLETKYTAFRGCRNLSRRYICKRISLLTGEIAWYIKLLRKEEYFYED